MEVMVAMMFMMANRNKQRRVQSQLLQRRRRQRRARVFTPRLSLSNFTDEEVHQHFRLSKAAIEELYCKIGQKIQPKTGRSQPVPGLTKLLATLHYLASGSFQYCVGGKLGISQPTFSRIFRQVLEAIISVSKEYIHFPQTEPEIAATKQNFQEMSGIPNIIGLIDCTHVAIIPPKETEQAYRNRKMFHSMNVQVVCGPDMRITDVVAKFPGSTHDSFILTNSFFGHRLASGYYGDSLLLGDNGYRLSPWLLTPYLTPHSHAEMRYNKMHKKTRGRIERLFGIWKSRFRCLDITGGALLYSPEMVCRIVVCCAILHNIAIHHNVPIQLSDDLREQIRFQGEAAQDRNEDGYQLREHITATYFGQ